uniref:Uncharacterized protein n=1 Tax=Pseudo-nitzschia australis TaxID=44445 RepID=A0A7S4AI20_9STRA|mmetsp:Transcript_3077/g.6636  ORF Transcript_3077/g.6636 Transcript_3077/m.6636 type:complete len:368 (+) Transcript_3077:35-1138(+)|eukprot:CAMPEP_0168213488 /NCGR_PEP_ID=MMETSP0140_2-20121125/4824_1 /TAXON_ID=44445 /ORGANISM="Pseudo-nitzschia australis, Strain 10249 10 AB" /LENGTH=367 /DNA_ID=CAMNT_0008140347 /DNA_START=65 /DNA_END=1168 /DNA_ORIENTATION=+
MDVIIPGPSIRPFCAGIGCLSRIGKELYIDFDPIDGLSIRSLNDSKSVFGSFHFEPAFFFRCRSAPASSVEMPSKSARRRKRKLDQKLREDGNGSDNGDGAHDDDDDDDERWTVRIAMKALSPVVRQRKEILNLRITTQGDHLAFEFKLQKIGGSVVRVTHKVGYSSAQGVAAVTATDGASELVVQPTVLSTMLEPLKRSIEIAILVNETHRLVSSVSFAHDDLPDDGASTLNREKQNASLKTETSVSYDDLVEVHYVGHGNSSSGSSGVEPPGDLKEQVVLVFTLKEFKAFLQYCSQAVVDQELQVSIQFFWGGKPIVAKTVGEQFSAELVMATLDHKLLGSMKTSATSTAVGSAMNRPSGTGSRH